MADDFEMLALAAAAKKKRAVAQPPAMIAGMPDPTDKFLGGVGLSRGVAPPQDPQDMAALEAEVGQRKREGAATPINSKVLGFAQGGSFGFGDEIGAAMIAPFSDATYGDVRDTLRGSNEAAGSANPGAYYSGQLMGALAAPLGGLKSIGKVGWDVAKGAVTGAGLSGLYGFGAGEGGFQERAKSGGNAAIIGALLGGAIPIAGAGIQRMAQNSANNRAIAAAAKGAPSTEDLHTAGNAAYRAVDDAGVQIRPQAFDRARGSILDDLRANTGFDELPGPGSLTPNSARVNEIMGAASTRMAAEPTAALPFSAVDQMRRQAGAAAGNVANKTDQKAGMSIISGLDDFINKLGPDDVIAGDVGALQSALPKARETWARMSKSQRIDDAIDAGGDYLSGASSGIRNQFRALLKSGKGGFTEAERTAMRRVVNGSIPEQLLNLASGGIGQIATTIGGGIAGGGLPGLIAGGLAAGGLRKIAEKVTTNKAEVVRALMANGGLPSLPQASQIPRQIIEKLMQRGSAAGLPR